jgi:hypothetical protein
MAGVDTEAEDLPPLFETLPVDDVLLAKVVTDHWGLTLGANVKRSQNHTYLATAPAPSDTKFVVRVTPDPDNKRWAGIQVELELLEYVRRKVHLGNSAVRCSAPPVLACMSSSVWADAGMPVPTGSCDTLLESASARVCALFQVPCCAWVASVCLHFPVGLGRRCPCWPRGGRRRVCPRPSQVSP